MFFGFDTSSVGAGSTVTTATLSVCSAADGSNTDFTLQARIFDWGGTLTTADWLSGNPTDDPSLDEKTLVASYPTASGFVAESYYALTSDAAFLSNIAQAATTYLVLDSSRQVSGSTPTTLEYLVVYMADDNTGGGGTDRDPRMYVEWTEPSLPDHTLLIQFGIC